jgi:glutamate racemase
MKQQSPIGVFDSGVGGLSIAKTIHNLMPNENVIYIADHLYSPYGNKSTETLQQRTSLIIDYFVSRDCKAIVVACNTATVHTIAYLRQLTDIPIIGVEPALKPASELSKTGVVGLLATQQTINSDSLLNLKSRFEDRVNVQLVACPLFVELVEQGKLDSAETKQAITHYIQGLIDQDIDHLVLGCTHYAFLIPTINQCIKQLTNKPVTIIEPSYPVCLELQRQLENRNLLSSHDILDSAPESRSSKRIGVFEFFSTQKDKGSIVLDLNSLFSLLWQQQVHVQTIELGTNTTNEFFRTTVENRK